MKAAVMNLPPDNKYVNTDELLTLCGDLGLVTPVAATFLKHQLENAILFDRKQQDYGSHNISRFGLPGILVRLSDKIERLATLTRTRRKPRNESIEDTLRDISVYATIALVVHKGNWPS